MSLWRRLLLAAAAGLLLAAGFPPWGVPHVLPVGLALLLLALRDADGRAAFYVGVLSSAIYLGGTQFWLISVFGKPAVSLIALIAAFPTLFCVLLGPVSKLVPKAPLPLVAGILWVGLEFYRAEWFALNFGWGALGYSVAGRPLFAPLASVVGVYGISFVLVALASLVSTERWKILALGALWAGLCSIQPASPTPERPLKVRLVQSMADETYFFKQTADASADIVLWPEYAVMEDPTNRLWPEIQTAVWVSNAYVIFGGKDYQGRRNDAIFKNTAYLLSPKGEILGKHVKNHTVHFITDGIRGKEARAFSTTHGKLGIAICFDMDYSDVARRLAADGAEVFFVPNMDPGEWGPVQQAGHRLLFAMRAMENGRWLARADVAGGTSVNAPTGQVTAQVSTSGDATLDTVVGRESGKTLYTRGGWLIGPLCCYLSALGVLMVALRGVRYQMAKRKRRPFSGNI